MIKRRDNTVAAGMTDNSTLTRRFGTLSAAEAALGEHCER